MTASVLEKAIKKWGKEAQTIVAMEECAELIKECSKMLRGQGNIDHLIEEIADVLICIEQLEVMYNIDNGDVLTEQVFKLERLEKRLEEMENHD